MLRTTRILKVSSGRRRIARRSCEQTQKLCKEELNSLVRQTRFDEEEIQHFYQDFTCACPDGQLEKSKIKQMYESFLPSNGNAALLVDQIFRIFDKDGDGSISFREFILATDMTASGTAEEKARWCFKMLDKDGSGAVEMEEVIEIISSLYETSGLNKDSVPARARQLFGELGGELGEQEFVRRCVENKSIMTVLCSGGLTL